MQRTKYMFPAWESIRPEQTWKRKGVSLLPVACFALLLVLSVAGCSEDDCICPAEYGAPRVALTYPAEGDTLAPPDTSITVTFDEAMDPAAISSGTFTLEGPQGLVAATVTYHDRTATLMPLVQLAGHSIHTARIDAGVTDIAGNRMGIAYAFSFTSGLARLMIYPDIEFTIRDNGKDGTADELVDGGPPGRHLEVGEAATYADRAIMEFELAEIVHDEVIEAVLILTFSSSTDPNTPARIEGWGFRGDGAGELADWSAGYLIVGYDDVEIREGATFAFPLKDTINDALEAGSTHAGFRLVIIGGPHAGIHTTLAFDPNDLPRALIHY